MLVSRLRNGLDPESLATTLRSIGDAVLTADCEARITFMNPVAELLTGWTLDEALGHKGYEVFRIKEETTGRPIKCPVARVLDNQEPTGYTNHTLIVSRDGTERPVAYNATPLVDRDGEMQGVVLVFHCARRVEALTRDQERFHLIERATNDAVWDWDVAGGAVWMNDAVTTLFGYDERQVRSDIEWWYERVFPHDVQRVRDLHRSALEDGMRHWQVEYRFQNADGTYSSVHERGYVMRGGTGEAIRLVGTVMDVTGRREAQEELLKLNAELERRVEERTRELHEANRELESFTYSVSHDLRAPLRGILFSTATLQEDAGDDLDDEAKATLARLVLSANRMSDLIDDLLRYSRLSRTRLHVEQLNLSAIAQTVADELRERGECRAQFEIEPNMRASGDLGLITILFENLLGNACKFTRNVEHPVVNVGTTEHRGERVFFVRDNGAGFNPNEAHRLFQPFERLHTDREFEGTGIGLANVSRIVNRHGGRIWARGELGKGATFYWTL